MSDTSPSLIERIKHSHDETAWRVFVDLYTPLLRSWCKRMHLPPDESDDLIQEVLVLLVRKIRRFQYDPALKFRGWLRTVLNNKLRECRRRPSNRLRTVGDSALHQVVDSRGDDEFWEREYGRHLLQGALDSVRHEFSPVMWRAFQATLLQEQSVAQVAADMGISPQTVYAARSRIKKRLREELAGLLD
jgi:RNA polymerase sigma-70 factor (ECF subfamily)